MAVSSATLNTQVLVHVLVVQLINLGWCAVVSLPVVAFYTYRSKAGMTIQTLAPAGSVAKSAVLFCLTAVFTAWKFLVYTLYHILIVMAAMYIIKLKNW